MNEWDRYDEAPLTEEELRRVRMNDDRMDQIYPIFGPLASILRNWKTIIAVVAVAVFIGSDRGRVILSAIAEVLP